jgi:hypothetical protein
MLRARKNLELLIDNRVHQPGKVHRSLFLLKTTSIMNFKYIELIFFLTQSRLADGVNGDSLALGVRDWTHCAQDRQSWKDLLGLLDRP